MMHNFMFENFEPSPRLQEFADRKLNEILDQAPSDSFPVARISAKKAEFEVTFELFSQAGYFVSRATNKFAHFAVEEAALKISDRLKLWRSTRDLEMPDPLSSQVMGFDNEFLGSRYKIQ